MEFADTECAHALLALAVSVPLSDHSPLTGGVQRPATRPAAYDESELVKRIRIDHNYTSEARDACGSREVGGKRAGDRRPSVGKRARPAVRRPHTVSGSDRWPDEVHQTAVSDLYEPSDIKFTNLHLLLKCLGGEGVAGGGQRRRRQRRRCHSSPPLGAEEEEDAGNRGGAGEATGEATEAAGGEFNCVNCQKAFGKRRYLTKHIRRMHPSSAAASAPAARPVLVLCPNCGASVARPHFERHSTSCHTHLWKTKRQLEVDLANCQFCGVRMRRHVLVRHLATEHCIDNRSLDDGLDDDEEEEEEEEEDEWSSSGGEEGGRAAAVGCPLCGARMARRLLVSHLTDVHWVAPPADDALLGRSLLKAILDSGEVAGGDTEEYGAPCPPAVPPHSTLNTGRAATQLSRVAA